MKKVFNMEATAIHIHINHPCSFFYFKNPIDRYAEQKKYKNFGKNCLKVYEHISFISQHDI